MKQSLRHKSFFQTVILRWFGQHGRDLPWRRTREHYPILVSEIMLQQTQVDHVIPKYLNFLARFPTAADLARATPRDVILQWSGLGYNRRALYLQQAAAQMVANYHGQLPSTIEELRRLPGVGPYTAGALLSFAYRRDQAALDTNIRRVIHRFFAGPEIPTQQIPDSELIHWAQSIIPRGTGWRWNHAMMDFGARVCTAKQPKCDACPLQRTCASAFKIQAVLATPRRRTKRRPEPAPNSTPHVPNRIYRGRIVEWLRQQDPEKTAAGQTVAKQIKPNFQRDEWEWFCGLLKDLERDGLIKVARQGKNLFLQLP
jgi:A/G-specific adenine glycosylase